VKRLLCAAAVAVAALVARPGEAKAYWGSPQCWQGFPWLQGKALNCMPWIHYHGPLYSYGPYNVPGYIDMYVKNPHCGAYIPAYPAGYYGYGYAGYGAPVQTAGATTATDTKPAATTPPTPTTTAPDVMYGGKGHIFGGLKGRFYR
jgi:hypothetical protein